MKASGDCCVVIPCLNEARHIAAVVREARRFVPPVFVVDDGSRDRTAEEARAAGAILLSHASSRGKGVALQAGFAEASARGFRWALAMDGDGQHAPADIPAFLNTIGSGGRLVIGNRMADAESMPWVRRVVNRWMSRTLSEFCSQIVPDSQCGFRLLHLPTWNQVRCRGENFEIESEIVVRFAAAGFSIRSVPVQTRYGVERSKIRPVRDTLRWIRWWRGIRRELGGRKPLIWQTKWLHDAA